MCTENFDSPRKFRRRTVTRNFHCFMTHETVKVTSEVKLVTSSPVTSRQRTIAHYATQSSTTANGPGIECLKFSSSGIRRDKKLTSERITAVQTKS